jgi:hypothetical protein
VTGKLLVHLGLPDEAPALEPAPETPQGKLWPTGPLAADFTQPSAPEEYDQRWSTIGFAERKQRASPAPEEFDERCRTSSRSRTACARIQRERSLGASGRSFAVESARKSGRWGARRAEDGFGMRRAT